MYLDYFGFKRDPFSISPDPHFLFLSEKHREALAHLLYGMQNSGGFVLLTGEVGTGKTTICRCLLEQIPPKTQVVLLWNPRLSVVELLASICDELEIPYPEGVSSVKVLIDKINTFLLDVHSRGQSIVIIIDEAQNLRKDVLEQIRLLTNLETNTSKLLQIILLGQPELLDMLNRPELRQLAQRVTARYHLLPLSREEVEKYLMHRLAVAGGSLPVFPRSTMSLIYEMSHGVPRVINILCSRALLGAYAQGEDAVSPELIKMAAHEVLGAEPGRRPWRRGLMIGTAVAAAALFGVLIVPETDVLHFSEQSAVETEAAPPEGTAEVAMEAAPTVSEPAAMEIVQTVPESAATETVPPAPQPEEEPLVQSEPAGEALLPEVETIANALPWLENLATVEQPPQIETGAETDPVELEQPQKREDPSEWIGVLSTGSDKRPAFQTLFHCWGIEYGPDEVMTPSMFAQKNGLVLQEQTGSFGYLQRLNRPAILRLTDLKGGEFSAVITGIVGENVVVQKGAIRREIAISSLIRQWLGEFTLLWQPPPGYYRVIIPGDRGLAVRWLARQFAVLHGREGGGDKVHVYNDELLREVKSFQLVEGLQVDGLAGPLTLIRLNTRTGGGQPQLVE